MEKLNVGVHLINDRHIPHELGEMLKHMRTKAAVVFWYQEPEDVIALGLDAAQCVVRLPGMIYDDWNDILVIDGERQPRRYFPSADTYAADSALYITKWYNQGFRIFVLGNEPDIPGKPNDNESWSAHGKSIWDFCATMADVVPDLRQRVQMHPGVVLLTTPLTAQPADAAIEAMSRIAHMYDGWAVHSYWQWAGETWADGSPDDSTMSQQMFGASFRRFHDIMNMPVWITECGNSIVQHANPPSLQTIARLQAQQYPRYCAFVGHYEYVKGIFFFGLGLRGWPGFNITTSVAAGIGSRLQAT